MVITYEPIVAVLITVLMTHDHIRALKGLISGSEVQLLTRYHEPPSSLGGCLLRLLAEQLTHGWWRRHNRSPRENAPTPQPYPRMARKTL